MGLFFKLYECNFHRVIVFVLRRYGISVIFYIVVYCGICIGGEIDSLSTCQKELVESALVQQGFENVRVNHNSDRHLSVEYENRVYRSNMDAAGIVASIATANQDDSCEISLVPLVHRMPVCSITFNVEDYREFFSGNVSPDSFAEKIKIVQDRFFHDDSVRSSKNKSFGKFDLVLYPDLSYQLGNLENSFKLYLTLSPEISTTLWQGFTLRGRYKIPLVDEIGHYKKQSSLTRLIASQFLRIPYNGLAVLNVGMFDPDRWGASGEAAWFLFKGHVFVGSKIDYTGFLLFREGVWNYSKPHVFTNRTFCYYNFDKVDVSLGINYVKFLLGDYGYQFEISRVFKEIEIGFFATRTNKDDFGGFTVKIPIFPNRRLRPGIVRISPPLYYSISYRSTSAAEILGGITETGVAVRGGVEIEDIVWNLTDTYIKNNIKVWKNPSSHNNE
jgi:hypothetical protein